MTPSDKCRVGECDRWAAASMLRDELPGPLRLCATHTEQFRQNGDHWSIDWDKGLAEPSSVIAPHTDGPQPARPAAAVATDARPRGRPGVFRSLLHRPGRSGRTS